MGANLRRVSITVPAGRVEAARATMIELFPEGFEEVDDGDDVELAAYTDPSGEERLWHAFGGGRGIDVEAGWDERWRAFHRPVRIGPLWVGPPWIEPPDGATAVVIDPGRAFGTGGHPTTRLSLELLVDLPRGSLIDVGCGSGVIAIAAAKLGFAPVVAVDVDPVAVDVTLENAAANRVTIEAFTVAGDDRSVAEADVAVANISLASVRELAPRVRSRHLVSSGYLVSDPPPAAGRRHLRRLESEGWVADLWGAGPVAESE